MQTIELPERSWHPDFMSTGGKEYGLTEELLTNMLPRLSPTRTTSGSLRLDELVVVGIPGEMAAGLGLHIKTKTKETLGVQHPVIGGLANEWVSYILSEEAYRSGDTKRVLVSTVRNSAPPWLKVRWTELAI